MTEGPPIQGLVEGGMPNRGKRKSRRVSSHNRRYERAPYEVHKNAPFVAQSLQMTALDVVQRAKWASNSHFESDLDPLLLTY